MSRKQINLYQAAFRPVQVVLPARTLLAGAILFLAALLVLYVWSVWSLASLRADVAKEAARAQNIANKLNQAALSQPPADPALPKEAAVLEARLRALQQAQDAVAAGALGSETGYAAQFRALSRTRVDKAWLTRITLADSGREMTLHGRALTGEDPARLIASLRREPLFVGLTYAALEIHPPSDNALPATTPARPNPRNQAGTSPRSLQEPPPEPPRFLEFSLAARLPEPTKPAAVPGKKP